MKEGSNVVVLGKLDERIREQIKSNVIKGTIFCFLRMEDLEVAVLLENGDIWTGKKREIQLIGE